MSEIIEDKKNKKNTFKSLRWCATIYEQSDYDELIVNKDIRFYCIGNEVCPTTERKHYQVYFELFNQQRFSYIKKHILKVSHFEPAKGTCEENINYCSKECGYKNLIMKGVPAQKGARNDLKNLYQMVKDGKSLKEILNNDNELILKSKQIEDLIFKLDEPRDYKPEVIVYWGLPATGKTYKAYNDNKGKCYVVSPPLPNSVLWYDGYDNRLHEVIIYEEFNGWISFNDFKIMTNNIPYKVNIKGGFINYKPKKIIFTSNYHPYQWYKDLNEIDMKAFIRRIDIIEYFDKQIENISMEPIDNTPKYILDKIKPKYNEYHKDFNKSEINTNQKLMI